MRHIFAIIGLTCALSAFTEPTMGHATAMPTATWSAEVVNTNAVPPRALVVKAWYPLSETDKRWSRKQRPSSRKINFSLRR